MPRPDFPVVMRLMMTLVMGQIEQRFPILSYKKDHQIQA